MHMGQGHELGHDELMTAASASERLLLVQGSRQDLGGISRDPNRELTPGPWYGACLTHSQP